MLWKSIISRFPVRVACLQEYLVFIAVCCEDKVAVVGILQARHLAILYAVLVTAALQLRTAEITGNLLITWCIECPAVKELSWTWKQW